MVTRGAEISKCSPSLMKFWFSSPFRVATDSWTACWLLKYTWGKSKAKLKLSLALPAGLSLLHQSCEGNGRHLSHLSTVNSIGRLVFLPRGKMVGLVQTNMKVDLVWSVRGENAGISLLNQTGLWTGTYKPIIFKSLLWTKVTCILSVYMVMSHYP